MNTPITSRSTRRRPVARLAVTAMAAAALVSAAPPAQAAPPWWPWPAPTAGAPAPGCPAPTAPAPTAPAPAPTAPAPTATAPAPTTPAPTATAPAPTAPAPTAPAPTTTAPAPTAPAPTSTTSPSAPADEAQRATAEMHRLVNEYRVQNGKAALTRDARVDKVAADWSATMARTGNFEHNPDFSGQLPSGWRGAAENIVMGSGSPSETTEQITKRLFDLWVNSPGHRANMLNGSYNTTGIGFARSADGAAYFTQNFATY